MSVSKHIYKKLWNTSNIQSVVDTRIYPDVAPQGTDFPCLVYSKTSIEPNDTKSGASTNDRINIQLDVYGTTYQQTETLSTRVRTALDRYSGTLESITFQQVVFIDDSNEGKDEDRNIFRVRQQYQIRIA